MMAPRFSAQTLITWVVMVICAGLVLYPLVFLCCVMLATYFVRPTNPRHALILSLVPLLNLAIAVACFCWWFTVGQ